MTRTPEQKRQWYRDNAERERASARRRYAADPSKQKANTARWRKTNPQGEAKATANWSKAHPEQTAARKVRWRENNRARSTAQVIRYQMQRRRALARWADISKIEAIYREAETRTKLTGVSHNVDHIIPLQGRTVCGLHVETNLRVITEVENKSKGNRLIEAIVFPVEPSNDT